MKLVGGFGRLSGRSHVSIRRGFQEQAPNPRTVSTGLQQAEFFRSHNSLRPAVDAQFSEEITQMPFDRAECDH